MTIDFFDPDGPKVIAQRDARATPIEWVSPHYLVSYDYMLDIYDVGIPSQIT